MSEAITLLKKSLNNHVKPGLRKGDPDYAKWNLKLLKSISKRLNK